MIPLKLHLKNFLSYGNTLQTIDFTPYQLICLSGKNGHGKSALLDAITWAIWGQARKIGGAAKPDAHLMRLGQQQMLVMFDFEFNGQQYRIRREFALTHGKQYASLDFGILQADKVIPLTNKTIRDTQTIIETTLGLDFDAFINSAFLRQGQSNEFSKKSPKERKEILGAILGLNHYEIVRKKALDKVKQAYLELDHLKKFQERNTQTLQRLPYLLVELNQIQESLTLVVNQEEEINVQKKTLETTKAALNQQRNQQQMLLLLYKQKALEQHQVKQQVHDCYLQWKNIHKKMLLMGTKSLEQQKKDISLKISTYQQKTQQALIIKEKLLQKKQEQQKLTYQAQSEYQQQLLIHQTNVSHQQLLIDTKKREIQNIQAQLSNLINEKNQQQLDIEKLKLPNATQKELLLKTVKVHEKQFEKRKSYYHQWITSANYIKSQADQLEHKYTLIYDENNPSCPLCEQTLSASRKRFLKGQFTKQEQFYTSRITRLTQLIKNLKQLLVEQHAQLNHYRKELEDCTLQQTRYQELLKNLEKLHSEEAALQQRLTLLIQELSNQELQIHELEQILSAFRKQEQGFKSNPLYLLLQQEIELLEQEAQKLVINDTTFTLLRQQQLELEQESNQLEAFQKDIENQEQRKIRINELITTLRIIKSEKKKLSLSLEQFNTLESSFAQLNQEDKIIQITVENSKKEKELLLQKKGYLENEHMQLQKLQEEYTLQEKKITQLDTTIFEYQAIASAVSKDGVQALIIEDSLPEIEHEANTLLSQLTDNQAHIIIESLRDLKKGGTKETLDIKISDSVGIRPYELFSGGEAFRIDFALRLAISKLLARRAGTSLQMLIIDEGFGSQDEEGLGHIMDCIYKIQHNFCKIIIVSHLLSMKEQFPVHFFVEKTSQGSSIRVIEQG